MRPPITLQVSEPEPGTPDAVAVERDEDGVIVAVQIGPPKRTARVGITIRLPEAVHEELRVLAFEQRTSKQALIEAWVSERLTPVNPR